MRLPFALRRVVLLVRDLVVDRNRPPLDSLAAETDPERFVWRVLPHAARTFSSVILMMPARLAMPCAVAYLYCRMLDTCEDLAAEGQRSQALGDFVRRFEQDPPGPPPDLPGAIVQDVRDEAHLLLLRRATLVDRVFVEFDAGVQRVILDLVEEMSDGMRWASDVFARQDGTLRDTEQLDRYCYGVLGTPMLFAVRLVSLALGCGTDLADDVRADTIRSGEFLQLANITRDIEKDLERGVAYHPALAARPADPRTIASVRAELLDRALARAPGYRRLVSTSVLNRRGLVRAAGVLMLLYTERYYRGCARRVGRPAESGPSGLRLLLRSLPAAFSRAAMDRRLERSERRLAELRVVS